MALLDGRRWLQQHRRRASHSSTIHVPAVWLHAIEASFSALQSLFPHLAAMSGVMGAGAESSTMPSMRPMNGIDATSETLRPASQASLPPPLLLPFASCCSAAALAVPHLAETAPAGMRCGWLPCSAASRSNVPRKMNPALLQHRTGQQIDSMDRMW